MTEAQLATLESLRDQILTLWLKIGDKYASYTEADLHAMAFKRGKTSELRTSFDSYTKLEAQRCIGLFMQIKAGYQQMWTKKWQGLAADRANAGAEDERIVRECLVFDQVTQWMREHTPLYGYIPSYFEFIKKIDGVGYWRKREKTLKLFNYFSAEQRLKSLNHRFNSELDFYQVFNSCILPGHDGTLYTPLAAYEELV